MRNAAGAWTLRRAWTDVPFGRKLAVLLLTLVTIPMLVLVTYNEASSRSTLIASSRAQNLERASGTAEAIDAFLEEARADVRTAALLSDTIGVCERPADPSVRDRARRSLDAVRREQGFLAVYVTDRSGRVLLATDARLSPGSYETGHGFLSAIAGNTAVEDPSYEPFDSKVAIEVAHAVRSGTEIVGVVFGLLDVTTLDQLVRHDTDYAGHGEFGILWNSGGIRLSDPAHPTLRFVPLADVSPDALVINQQRLGPAMPPNPASWQPIPDLVDRGAWLAYEKTGDPHVRVAASQFGALQATIVPVEALRWSYALLLPEERLLADLRRQTLRDLAVALLTVLIAVALSVTAAKWVTTPLRSMTDTVAAFGTGDLTRRVELDQRDEIGRLAAAFNAMAASLSQKDQELRAHAVELEHRVQERTAVLQLLERASRAFGSSLDLDRAAGKVGDLLVPDFAQFFALDVDDGQPRRVASRETQPDGEEHALRYPLLAGEELVGHLLIAPKADSGPFDETVMAELARRTALFVANARLYRQAQDANRLKDEFLGVVSHELRTPLNAILGWTRLAALTGAEGFQPSKALEAVERNARALARLVDDLLDVPRIMTGKLALDRRPIDLVAVLSSAIDAMRPVATSKGVALFMTTDVPSVTLLADPNRLQQVFWNLLSNAVKFTPSGGRIAARLASANGQLTVTISDNGMGIARDFLPFVFERFTQADSSTTRSHGGLGIGLSIVRHLVEMHGGMVSAESAGLNQGSTFTVTLPGMLETPVAPPDLVRDDPAHVRRSELAGLRVLILDDDVDSMKSLELLMTSLGAEVATATSVGDALRRIADPASRTDVVVADIAMPEEDGYVFIERVRQSADPKTQSLGVIAVTAYAAPADRKKALDAGFDEHLPKPVDIAQLCGAIARVTSVSTLLQSTPATDPGSSN